MVQENVNIAFRSTGIPVIKRQLDELGIAANNATRGFFLLQRAIYTLGGFGLARALTGSLDALANMENRLRLTTSSTAELESVQKELFQVALRSRTSWEGVTEVYNRAALSAKALGISQKDVMTFTEGVSKSAAISGAGAQEAHAALIQLGQAIASNRLGGDELRSVLEQLPMAADVIAKYMTSTGKWGEVNRGNIRQLGKEGKITAEVIVEAFKYAKSDLDAMFASMPLTIGQSIENLKTRWAIFIDEMDDTYNISEKIAKIIQFVADNLETLAKIAISAAGAVAAVFAVNTASSAARFVSSIAEAGVKINALRAAKTSMAAADVAAIQRDLAANRIRQIQIGQNLTVIQQKKSLIAAEIAETEFSVANGRARSLQTGQFVALEASKERLAALTINLSRLEAVEAAQAGKLAGARAAQAGATNALAGANTRLAGAQAAQAGTMARLGAQFPIIAGAIAGVGSALSGLWAVMLSNPITAVILAIIAVGAAIAIWGDQLAVTADGVVSLKDWCVAAFQLILEAIKPVTDFLVSVFVPQFEIAKNAVSAFGSFIVQVAVNSATLFIDALTAIPRLVIGIVMGIAAAWDFLPGAAAEVGVGIANALIAGFEMFANGAIKAINLVIGALNKLLAFVGADKAAEWFGFSGQLEMIAEKSLPRMTNTYKGAGKTAAEAFSTGFNQGWNTGTVQDMANTVSGIGSAVTKKARENAQTERADAILAQKAAEKAKADAERANGTGGTGGGGGGGGGGGNQASFASLIADMNQEIALLKMSNKERTIAKGLLEMEKTLKRGLTDQEKEHAIATIQQLEAAKVQAEVLESIIGPREKAIEQMAALNVLFAEGKINVDQYAASLRNMQAAADAASGTLAGGFRSAISNAITSASDFGKAIGGEVVGFVNSAADAIVKFAQTGKISIRDLFGELFANLLKLAAQRLMLSFLGNILGIPTGAGGAGGGLGFATGGSILPSGPGSTDSQLVAFSKRPDERVDILTPAQQRANQKEVISGNSQAPVPAPNVNVSVVLSENDVANAMSGRAGNKTVINAIERNKSTIKRILNS